MKILVLSDSHGNSYNIRKALDIHKDINRIVFLGDGERDIDCVSEEIGSTPLTAVRGNCDSSFSSLNTVELLRAGNHLIYCTHGYMEHVKYGIGELMKNAKTAGADIVLYGHTHLQECSYEDGIYIMNPGSINDYEYGIVEISPAGVMMNKLSLR